MRINDTNSNSKLSSIRKKGGGKTNGAGASFSIEMGNADSASEGIQEAQPLMNIQSVLTVDAVGILSRAGDEEYVKQQNISWGKDVITVLEDIKHQILNGKISRSSLLALQERLGNIPINPQDHKLQQIVQEIEIRAAVELEKLNKLTNQEEV